MCGKPFPLKIKTAYFITLGGSSDRQKKEEKMSSLDDSHLYFPDMENISREQFIYPSYFVLLNFYDWNQCFMGLHWLYM